MLEVKNLSFKHKKQKDYVLKDINFQAEKGKITAILGPNGSGKSTLFKCITGIWKSTSGNILVDGKDITELSYLKRAKIFAVVPQEHETVFPYSVFDMVLMGRACYVGLFSTPSKQDYYKAEESLKALGIYHLREKPYTQISGGERQLVLIARALAQEAGFMLFDEPTSNLDFKNQIRVLTMIKKLTRERNITVLLSLHDPNLAGIFADQIVMIKNGSVLKSGKPAEVLNEKFIEELYSISVRVLQTDSLRIIYPEVEKFLQEK